MKRIYTFLLAALLCAPLFAQEAGSVSYYIVGNMNVWTTDSNYLMTLNTQAETEEYVYTMDLTTASQFKVLSSNGIWYPQGSGNNYGENGEITEEGNYTIYFRPNANGGNDWFHNVIYVVKNNPQGQGNLITWDQNFCSTVEAWIDINGTLSHSNNSRDGITVTFVGDEIQDGFSGGMIYFYSGTSSLVFTSTVGNISKIEITGFHEYADPAGWTWNATSHKLTWEGTPTASVSLNGVTNDIVDISVSRIDFTIGGESPTALESLTTTETATKRFRNGRLLIEKDGKTYNALGVVIED